MAVTRIAKNLFRTREILTVFFRHGFGDLVQRMGLARFLRFRYRRDKAQREPPEPKTPAKRFREALEELGGAFVKLGQLLSTRPDILPTSWIEELTPLQDDVLAVDFLLIQGTLEAELGPLSSRFRFVDPNPLATGSIAQVHTGVTLDGDEVVIKVCKPGVKEAIFQDIDILEALAEVMEKHVPESRNYQPVNIARQFREAATDELDFTREGRNLDRFRADFEPHPHVIFPRVYWDQTTERVLTMERIYGVKISLVEYAPDAGINRDKVPQNLAEAVLRQILEFGFFHGDPHPGNIVVVGEEDICFFDCGLVGRLDERLRENLLLLVSAAIRRDIDMLVNILADMDTLPQDLERARFVREANLFVERYYRIPLGKIRLSSIVQDIMEIIRRFGIRIPSDVLLIGKALITLEGVGRTLDPDFDAVSAAEPFVRQLVMTTYGPKVLGRRFAHASHELLRLLADLPYDLREFSRSLRENRLRLQIEHRGLSEPVREMNRASKRVSISLVTSSVVLASSVIVLASTEPRFMGVPIFGIIGFAIAATLSLWLLVSTLRDNRR
jgi:ubiquinone biosynthesis protein